MGAVAIRGLGPEEARAAAPGLAALLVEAAAGGAEVSFLAPVPFEKAVRFWSETADAVGAGSRILLIAEDGGGIVGTVQVEPVRSETAPRMASVAKLIVAVRARRAGLGAALLDAAERAALAAGRDILVLDTEEHGAAHSLYLRAGWALLGAIPDATLRGDGTPCSNAVFWKRLVA